MKAILPSWLLLVFFLFATSPLRAGIINISTGVDRSTGALLPDGSTDPNYQLTAVPTGVLPGVAALVGSQANIIADNSSIIPPAYLKGSTTSQWLGFINSVFPTNPLFLQQGFPYTIQTTVDLTGVNASLVEIDDLLVADDNKLLAIRINGNTIFSQTPDSSSQVTEEFHSFRVFPNPLGQGLFHLGSNTIDFDIQNSGEAPSPLALRVEGDVRAVPEPATLILAGIGLLGFAGYTYGHRNRK